MRKVKCPHCDHVARIESVRQVTSLVRDHTCYCQNFECGCTFLVRSEIAYVIRPPATPNPRVNLPSSARFLAKPPATPPIPANDGDLEELAEA